MCVGAPARIKATTTSTTVDARRTSRVLSFSMTHVSCSLFFDVERTARASPAACVELAAGEQEGSKNDCLVLAGAARTAGQSVQCRPERSDRRDARSKTTAVTTTTRQAGSFARGITWARARRRAKSRKCTSAPNRLATHATTVATSTCGGSQTCAMTALECTPFASTGATLIQGTAGAASVSCVSSAGRAETMGQL